MFDLDLNEDLFRVHRRLLQSIGGVVRGSNRPPRNHMHINAEAFWDGCAQKVAQKPIKGMDVYGGLAR